MKRKVVGFYWTLPVPWAGFTALPEDIDAAARASLTIRYQRAAIRKYAHEEGFELIHEAVFMEIAPDRGSELVREPLAKVEAICWAQNAALLYVDFGEVQGWRGHAPMHDWSQQSSIEVLPIYPEPVWMDGGLFDPHKHFGDWREKQGAWSASKPARAEQARSRAMALQATELGYPEIASRLNAEGIRSLSGKPWSGESLRKFLLSAPKPR